MIKNIVQKIVIFLNHLGFKPLLVLPYKAIFGLTKYILDDRFLSVWPRNSFHFGIINPGISDIDLTLFFAQATPKEQRKKSLGRLASLKRIFPVLGEANVYRANEIGLFKEAGNFFELRRDPKLFSRLDRCWTKQRIASDAAVFALRALWSDYAHLKACPEQRRHKWGYIFQALNAQMGLDLSLDVSLESICANIVLIAPCLKRDISVFANFFEDRKNETLCLAYLRLYPHYWLGDYHGHGKFKEFLSSLSHPSPEAQGIVRSQVAWEIWGIYSQIPLLPADGSLGYHFLNLRKILGYLDCRTDVLLDDIGVAEEILKNPTSS